MTTDLDQQVPAQVESLADIVEDDPQQGPTVLTTLSFDRAAASRPPPGSDRRRPHRLRRTVDGTVWFHRLIETVKTWWEF